MRYKISPVCLLLSGNADPRRRTVYEESGAVCLLWPGPNRSGKVTPLLIGILTYCLVKDVVGRGSLSSPSLVSAAMCNFQGSAFMKIVATSCLIGVKEEGEEEQKPCGIFKMVFKVTKEAIRYTNTLYLIAMCCFTNGLCQITVGLYCLWLQWYHTAKKDVKSDTPKNTLRAPPKPPKSQYGMHCYNTSDSNSFSYLHAGSR